MGNTHHFADQFREIMLSFAFRWPHASGPTTHGRRGILLLHIRCQPSILSLEPRLGTLKFTRDTDVLSAANCYDRHKLGLGVDFLECV